MGIQLSYSEFAPHDGLTSSLSGLEEEHKVSPKKTPCKIATKKTVKELYQGSEKNESSSESRMYSTGTTPPHQQRSKES